MFYKIKNSDGKCWWMPVRNVRMGLALYQPSGWKGRLLKRWFPYVHWLKVVRAVLGIEKGKLRIENLMPEEVRKAVCEAFGVERFEYSVFEGTPSVHQKITIQVWNEERILGYVKMTENEEVGRLFFREAEFLKKITDNRLQITHFVRDFYSARHNEQAPSALANRKNIQITDYTDICGEKSRRDDRTQTGVSTPGRVSIPPTNPVGVTEMVPDVRAFIIHNSQFTIHNCEKGLWVLVQTTRKSLKSEMVREWGALQEEFLEMLHAATAREVAWEECDLARALRDLREHIDWLPDGVDGDAVAKRIDAVMERMAGKRVMYGAYHGDFTPWNMFVEGGELFVFDWEYAGWTYPKGLDRYHFWLQTALLVKHWGVKEIVEYMASERGRWIDREMLEWYLMDVMSKYVVREGKRVTDVGMFGVWSQLVVSKMTKK